jgi:hypothetical protein
MQRIQRKMGRIVPHRSPNEADIDAMLSDFNDSDQMLEKVRQCPRGSTAGSMLTVPDRGGIESLARLLDEHPHPPAGHGRTLPHAVQAIGRRGQRLQHSCARQYSAYDYATLH